MDNVPEDETKPTIADIVLASGGDFDGEGGDFDILLQALQAAGLADVVAEPDADLTVFAPTDQAFVELARSLGAVVEDGDDAGAFAAIVQGLTDLAPDGDPIPLLRDVLLYHVSPGAKSAVEIENAQTIETAVGATIHARDGELVDNDPDIQNPSFVEGATDIEASNGVVQVIDRVLLPIDVPPPPPTIADIVTASGGEFDDNSGDFDVLFQALQAAGLTDAVADRSADLTVFAPTDGAFIELANALGADVHTEVDAFQAIVEALTALSPDGDPIPILTDVLLYHVVAGGQTVHDLQEAGSVETLLGANVTIDGMQLEDLDPDVVDPMLVEGATDIETANGVIQAIDRVLLPADLPNSPDLSRAPEFDDLDALPAEAIVEPSLSAVSSDEATSLNLTFLGEDAGFDNTAGYYLFDAESGEIEEGFVFVTSSDDAMVGDSVEVTIEAGQGLVPFIIPNGGNLGVDFSAFADGGLTFTNPDTGDVATIFDDASPIVNALGTPTGIVPLHGLDGTPGDGANALNADSLVHATTFSTGNATVFAFEDLLGGGDGDFNDVGLAASEAPLSPELTLALGEIFTPMPAMESTPAEADMGV
ncbi:MAG: fasciclin domain-containing protein [Pseudomonadota bacterium]